MLVERGVQLFDRSDYGGGGRRLGFENVEDKDDMILPRVIAMGTVTRNIERLD